MGASGPSYREQVIESELPRCLRGDLWRHGAVVEPPSLGPGTRDSPLEPSPYRPEVTGTASIYTDNSSFFNGNLLQQDPYFAIDGSIDYSFQSGIWASVGVGIGVGGQSAVNGVEKDNRRGDIGWLVSAGFPITRSLGFKANYLETDHWAKVGIQSQTISVGLVGSW